MLFTIYQCRNLVNYSIFTYTNRSEAKVLDALEQIECSATAVLLLLFDIIFVIVQPVHLYRHEEKKT